MEKGVEIILVSGTKVPWWIRSQLRPGETCEKKRRRKRYVRSLKIEKGDAFFAPGGTVEVKMPGSNKYRSAFEPLQVLEIRDSGGHILERNYFLCEKCFANTGRIIGTLLPNTNGKRDVMMQCTRCRRKWVLRDI